MKIYYGNGFVDVFTGIGFENHTRFNLARKSKELIFHRTKGNQLERPDYFNMKYEVTERLTGGKK